MRVYTYLIIYRYISLYAVSDTLLVCLSVVCLCQYFVTTMAKERKAAVWGIG